MKNLGYYDGKYDLIENMSSIVARGINMSL